MTGRPRRPTARRSTPGRTICWPRPRSGTAGSAGIAFRLVSDTYIALFSHFIPCGVWEAVYILDSLLANSSDLQTDQDPRRYPRPIAACLRARGVARVRAAAEDPQLARPELLPAPSRRDPYEHIDSLFGNNVIDWELIDKALAGSAASGISICKGRLSSVTLLRRLGNHSRRNRLYKALRELGRVIRTITLLRYLSELGLRDQIAAVTNRTEAFHNFAQFLMIGGRLIGHNDPEYQERVVKFNELVANCGDLLHRAGYHRRRQRARRRGIPGRYRRPGRRLPVPAARYGGSATGSSTSPHPITPQPPAWTWNRASYSGFEDGVWRRATWIDRQPIVCPLSYAAN